MTIFKNYIIDNLLNNLINFKIYKHQVREKIITLINVIPCIYRKSLLRIFAQHPVDARVAVFINEDVRIRVLRYAGLAFIYSLSFWPVWRVSFTFSFFRRGSPGKLCFDDLPTGFADVEKYVVERRKFFRRGNNRFFLFSIRENKVLTVRLSSILLNLNSNDNTQFINRV